MHMKGVPITKTEYKRFLSEDEALTYLGMNKAEFRRDCPVIPKERAQGRKVWDVVLLDAWQDGDVKKPDQFVAALNRL